MSKIKKIILLLIIASLCCFLAVGCADKDNEGDAGVEPPTVEAPVVTTPRENSALKSIYALNEKLYSDNLIIDVNGETYKITECNLEFPDGKRYDKTEYELSEVGEYSLYYTARLGTKLVKDVAKFKVVRDNFYVSSENSSAAYAENIEYTVFKETSIKGDVYTYWGQPESSSVATANGIKVSLAEGDEFTWAKPIKISQGYNELFNIIVPQAYPDRSYPSAPTSVQAEKILVTFTDCYDPMKTLRITFDCTSTISQIWVRTSVNGDVESSLNSATGDWSYYIDYRDAKYLYLPESISTDRHICIYGERGDQFIAKNEGGLTVALDADNAYVYTYTYGNVEKKSLTNMLNNTEMHEDVSKHFYGFTNGEAYMTIKCEDYKEPNCEFILTDILGASETELKGEKYYDTVKPLINLSNDLDYVNVVSGTTFNVFEAECYDVNLKGEYKVSCYYNYGTPNQVTLKIEDGKVYLPMQGKYTLIYSISDTFGNVENKIVTLNAQKTASGRGIDYVETNLTEVMLGELVEVPSISPVGLNGEIETKASVTFIADGSEVKIDKDNKFMCLNQGKYNVKYVMTDGVYTEEYSFEIEGKTNSENIQFLDQLYTDKYFIKGRTYYLENYYAYTFENATPTQKLPTVYAKVDGGAYEVINNYNNYVPNANNSVQFKYEYEGVVKESNQIQVVVANDDDGVDLAGYFNTDANSTASFVSTDSEAYVNLSVKDNTDYAKIDFVNPISFKLFNISFKVPDKISKGKDGNNEEIYVNSEFSRLNFIFTDYYDSSKVITITYVNGANFQMIVNGKAASIPDFINNNDNINIVDFYNNGVRNNAAESVSVENPFISDKVMLSISFEKVKKETELHLYQINNQSLSGNIDNGKPMVTANDIAGTYAVGEELTVFAPCVTDVLSTLSADKITVAVSKIGGGYLKDVNGVELRYVKISQDIKVKLDEIGSYFVEYLAVDDAGVSGSLKYKIIVVDVTKPTIELVGGVNTNTVQYAKLNDTITVAGYVASDNVTSSDKLSVSISVVTPYNEIIVLQGNTFVASRTGKYRIIYLCTDSNGNIQQTYYTISVA